MRGLRPQTMGRAVRGRPGRTRRHERQRPCEAFLRSGTREASTSSRACTRQAARLDGRSLDRQKSFETHPLHDRHDVLEAGALQKLQIAVGREWLEHALETSRLAENFVCG